MTGKSTIFLGIFIGNSYCAEIVSTLCTINFMGRTRLCEGVWEEVLSAYPVADTAGFKTGQWRGTMEGFREALGRVR